MEVKLESVPKTKKKVETAAKTEREQDKMDLLDKISNENGKLKSETIAEISQESNIVLDAPQTNQDLNNSKVIGVIYNTGDGHSDSTILLEQAQAKAVSESDQPEQGVVILKGR